MKITRDDMKPWIVEALKASAGSKAWPKDVARYVWDNHQTELKASGDIIYTWQYDLRWAAMTLRKEGTLKPVHRRTDLPWELA
jgi:hypothetical protein